MIPFIIKLCITLICVVTGASLTHYATISSKLSPYSKIILIAVITTIIALLSSETTDSILKKVNRPIIAIKTNKRDNELNININIDKGSLDQIAIDYPIVGHVTTFQDLNSITDANTSIASIIGGSKKENIQNNIEILIRGLRPNSKLQYKVFYDPLPVGIFVVGPDRYKVSYIWEYKGERISESEWRLVENDNKVGPPDITVKGALFYNRVLTPEEIKRLYKEGPPRQTIK